MRPVTSNPVKPGTNRAPFYYVLLLVLLITSTLYAASFFRKQSPSVQQLAPSPEAVVLAHNISRLHTLDATSAHFCSWSSDGRTLDTLGQLAPEQYDVLQHWDVATGKIISTSLPYCSPDRRIAGIVDLDNTINFIDVQTGQYLRQLKVEVPSGEILASPGITSSITYSSTGTHILQLSKDGRELVTATNGATQDLSNNSGVVSVQLWDATDGVMESYVNIPDHPFLLQQYDISPDTTTLAASYFQYGPDANYLTIDLWDLRNARHLSQVNELLPASGHFFWSPDSRTLAVVTDGRQVTLIDAATSKVTLHLPEVLPDEYTPTPNPNPIPIGTVAGTMAPLPRATSEAGAPFPVTTAAPPGYVPPITPVALLPKADANDYQTISNVVWSPDGSTIATYDHSYIRLWDAASGSLKAIARHPYAVCDRIWPMSWSPDGRLLATLDCDQEATVLRLWDGSTAAPLRELTTDLFNFHWSPSVSSLTLLVERQGTLGVELWGTPVK